MQTTDKTALVTGGAKRIGAAIVEDLAENGFAVAIHCNRSTAEAAALAQRIKQRGGRAIVFTADLTDSSQTERLIGNAAAALGPVRLLVNSASIFEDDTAAEPDFALWDR